MNDLLLLSHSKFARFWIKIGIAFKNGFLAVKRFFINLPNLIVAALKKIGSFLATPYYAMRYGDWKTRLSFLIFGFGNLAHKQWLRGFALLLTEIAFILYMTLFGAGYLGDFGTLGTTETYKDPNTGFTIIGDDSFNILLYGTLSIIIILFVVYLWFVSIKQAYEIQYMSQINRHLVSASEDLRNLGNQYYHVTLLSVPSLLLLIFTIIPLIFMIFVAFTNFDNAHQPPNNLFTWVGLSNFQTMLFGGGLAGGNTETFSYTFWTVLAWTLIWAVLATVTNFVFGMIVALLINKKSIKLKKVWRTFLVTSIAVPQLVSLLLMSKMLSTTGVITNMFAQIGIQNVRFLLDPMLCKVTIIIVNMWIGIPYTVLSCTGILMNIPDDLYEAARIDGANPYRMYVNITLPYVLFVMGPSLISTFVGNINNFNVIYLLTGGGPNYDTNMHSTAGQSDLLITWLYKLTVNDQDYSMASTIGILVFIVCAVLSLIAYSRIGSTKNEEDFQ